MLPLVSNDAVAILFMFDLTRKSTLNSIKEWYRQARGFNKVCLERDDKHESEGVESGIDILDAPPQTAIPVLIGTKYDQFATFARDEQDEITRQAKRFSKAMHAPLVSRINRPQTCHHRKKG
jgi:GTP-binding protein of the ras superfamily involved in termination of M-phase